MKKVSLGLEDPSKTVTIGANMDPKLESVLIEFPCANSDIFAYKLADMPAVPRELFEHSLKVDVNAKLIK
jgi:hypothetical protein